MLYDQQREVITKNYAREDEFLFKISETDFRVLAFKSIERLSHPFKLTFTLVSEEQEDFDAVIGKEAVLEIISKEENRYFHGIINNFTLIGSKGRFLIYTAEMVPSLWMLCLKKDFRIFQNMSTPEIVGKILKENFILNDRFIFRLQNHYKKREYCVQYNETSLDFISRLLEEEGIFYFFEHHQEKHVIIFGDGSINYLPIPGKSQIYFRSPDMYVIEEEFVYKFSLSRQIKAGKITLKDYNFEKPFVDLTTNIQANRFQFLEQYEYPGRYKLDREGKDLVKIRLKESVMFTDQGKGESNSPRFVPGFTFELTMHENEAFNKEYLFVNVQHIGSQPQVLEEEADLKKRFTYLNKFQCIPSSVVYKPERKTPKAVVKGVQSAIVVGPKDEEIYTDKYGRIKVQFHWDRLGKKDEYSSCWIRVSQAWAGAGWGSVYIPRIGQEVIVGFEEGDPDRPIIIGRVYHSLNLPPYSLPDEKTKSTLRSNSSPGGNGDNEIRFEDKKGEEEIYLHGKKNLNILIENDKSQCISNNESLSVGKNRAKSVGLDHTESIGSNKSIKVGKNHIEEIGENMSIMIKSNLNEKIGSNSQEIIGSKKVLKAGSSININAGDSITLSCGASKIYMNSSGLITISGLMLNVLGAINANIAAPITSVTGTIMLTNTGALNLVTGNIVRAEGKSVGHFGGKKAELVANGDCIVKGKKVKLN